jgi:hypothetical protein
LCAQQEADECCRDAVERDERRLADLGRRCVELYAATHIAATRIEASLRLSETERTAGFAALA